mmetsp:Transcript_11273/g.19203  ORF Transcript_11273/g.19203 Transcript_11273/m.19203 type:complete len:98 (-) Transcript_11273:182-475(-)
MLTKRFLVVAVVGHCWHHATAIFHAIVDVKCWKFLPPKPHDDSDLVTYQYGDGEIHLDFLVVAVAVAGVQSHQTCTSYQLPYCTHLESSATPSCLVA